MTTLTSTLALSTIEAKRLHAGSQSVSGAFTSTLTSSAALIFRLCHLPKGAVVTDLTVAGGSGVCTTDVGVTEDDNIFIAALSTSPAMAPTKMNVLAGLGYTTTTATYLINTTDATSAASADGSMRFSITYHMDNPV